MERIVQYTSDGSHTISVPSMEVSYHSKHGAIQESSHVFIEAGLNYQQARIADHIDLLEIGFGTGLNALLSILAQGRSEIRYETLEPFPLEREIVKQLNYCDRLNNVDLQPIFNELHQSDWGKEIKIKNKFVFVKQKIDLNIFVPVQTYDLIYFDAFDPKTQPGLWTTEIFQKLYSCLKENGILVTYCSKSIIRRSLQAAGFIVEKIPGPYGKREMVRAIRRK